MSDRPVPIDLVPYAEMITRSREFVRLWARDDGAILTFVNPVPLGPDPAAFGIALVDCIHQAADAYARAVNIPEEDALARILEGFDAERSHPTLADTPPVLEI